MLQVDQKVLAVETEEGAGVRVRRLLPTPKGELLDPFVLLNEFFVGRSTGFPPHLHRGFEAITYMVEGSFWHENDLGNERRVDRGGVQRFTTGKGLTYSEMPGSLDLNRGFQLWINLPQRLKTIKPSYQQVEPEEIPEERERGRVVRTIVGPGSPTRLQNHVTYGDIWLDAKREYTFIQPVEHVGFVYVYEGLVTIREERLLPGEALVTRSNEETTISTREDSRFLIISGKPHNEPIKIHGSFVD